MRRLLLALLLSVFAIPAAAQAPYQREEQHRFEILVSHLDLPVTDITPSK
jgi:hypothetical protein